MHVCINVSLTNHSSIKTYMLRNFRHPALINCERICCEQFSRLFFYLHVFKQRKFQNWGKSKFAHAGLQLGQKFARNMQIVFRSNICIFWHACMIFPHDMQIVYQVWVIVKTRRHEDLNQARTYSLLMACSSSQNNSNYYQPDR